MAIWDFCIDESYNTHLFCVGGFLAPREVWHQITSRWRERIAYENRKSTLKNHPPISRYHATDCAGLKKEFDPECGWNISRQIRLTKRLCRIIGNAGPCGIVVGGRVSDIKHYLGESKDCPKESLYDLCFRMSLVTVVSVLREWVPGTQVRVIYDHGKNFGGVARASFDSFQGDKDAGYMSESFTELRPENSREWIELQTADFLAYEAMRQLDGIRRGNEHVRKSLQALIGTDIPLHIAQFTNDNFADMRRMIDNKKNGRPIAESIESALAVPVSSQHPMALLP